MAGCPQKLFYLQIYFLLANTTGDENYKLEFDKLAGRMIWGVKLRGIYGKYLQNRIASKWKYIFVLNNVFSLSNTQQFPSRLRCKMYKERVIVRRQLYIAIYRAEKWG